MLNNSLIVTRAVDDSLSFNETLGYSRIIEIPFSEAYTNLNRGRLLFGSCFDENRLVTRIYNLSTGVSFRGTPGSQLFQVDGSIQVAVDRQAIVITDVYTLA